MFLSRNDSCFQAPGQNLTYGDVGKFVLVVTVFQSRSPSDGTRCFDPASVARFVMLGFMFQATTLWATREDCWSMS